MANGMETSYSRNAVSFPYPCRSYKGEDGDGASGPPGVALCEETPKPNPRLEYLVVNAAMALAQAALPFEGRMEPWESSPGSEARVFDTQSGWTVGMTRQFG